MGRSIRSEHISSSDEDEEYSGNEDQGERRNQASHVIVSSIERLKSTVRSNSKIADIEAKYKEYEEKIKAYEAKITQLSSTIQGLETTNKGLQEISEEKNTLQSRVEKLTNDLNRNY